MEISCIDQPCAVRQPARSALTLALLLRLMTQPACLCGGRGDRVKLASPFNSSEVLKCEQQRKEFGLFFLVFYAFFTSDCSGTSSTNRASHWFSPHFL